MLLYWCRQFQGQLKIGIQLSFPSFHVFECFTINTASPVSDLNARPLVSQPFLGICAYPTIKIPLLIIFNFFLRIFDHEPTGK